MVKYKKIIKVVIPAFVIGGIGVGAYEFYQSDYSFSPQFAVNAFNQNHIQFDSDGLSASDSQNEKNKSLEQDNSGDKYKHNQMNDLNSILFQNKNQYTFSQTSPSDSLSQNVANSNQANQEMGISRENPTISENGSSSDSTGGETTIIVPSTPNTSGGEEGSNTPNEGNSPEKPSENPEKPTPVEIKPTRPDDTLGRLEGGDLPSFPSEGIKPNVDSAGHQDIYTIMPITYDSDFLSNYYVFHKGEIVTEEKILYSFNLYVCKRPAITDNQVDVPQYRIFEFDNEFFRLKTNMLGKAINDDALQFTVEYRLTKKEPWKEFIMTVPVFDTSVYIYTNNTARSHDYSYIKGMNKGDEFELDQITTDYRQKKEGLHNFDYFDDTYTVISGFDDDWNWCVEDAWWEESETEVIAGYSYNGQVESNIHVCQEEGIERLDMVKQDIDPDQYKVYWIKDNPFTTSAHQWLVHVEGDECIVPEGITNVCLMEEKGIDSWFGDEIVVFQQKKFDKIYIPASVKNFDYITAERECQSLGFNWLFEPGFIDALNEYSVSVNNLNYASDNGLLLDKKKSILYNAPLSMDEVYVPETCTKIQSINHIDTYHFDSRKIASIEGLDNNKKVIDVVVPNAYFAKYYAYYHNNPYVCVKSDQIEEELIVENGFVMNPERTVLYYVNEDEVGVLSLPDSISLIKQDAFADCIRVDKLVLNSEVYAEGNSFSNESLKEIFVNEGASLHVIEGEQSPFCQEDVQVYVPKDSYKNHFDEWELAFPDENISSLLSDDAFAFISEDDRDWLIQSKGLTLIKANDSIEVLDENILPQSFSHKDFIAIEAQAFSHNDTLTHVFLPETVKTIGYEAFSDCKNLLGFISYQRDTIEVYQDAFKDSLCMNYIIFNALEADFKDDYNPAAPFIVDEEQYVITCISCINGQGYPVYFDEDGNEYSFDALIDECEVYQDNGNYLIYSKIDEEYILIKAEVSAGYTVTLYPHTKEIYDNAFIGCSEFFIDNDSLSEVERIGYCAFNSTEVINSIKLPATLTDLGEYAFYSCKIDGNMQALDQLRHLPEGVFYGASIEGNLFLPEKIELIGNYAFATDEDNYNVFDHVVEMPDSLKSIGDEAFRYTYFNGGLYLNEEIESLGEGSFYDTVISGDLIIPGSLTDIGMYGFEKAHIEKNLIFSDDVTQISDGSFLGCVIGGTIKFNEGLQSIGMGSFQGVDFDGQLVLPDSLVSIGALAFSYSSIQGKVELKENIEYVGNFAFQYCQDISEVYIDGSHLISDYSEGEDPFSRKDALGDEVFGNCDNLKKVEFSSNCQLSVWKDYFVYTGIEEIDLPASITHIDDCSKVKYNGNSCFSGCSNLKTIRLHSLQAPKLFSMIFIDGGAQEDEIYGFEFGCESNEEFKIILPEGCEDEYRQKWKYALVGFIDDTTNENYDDEKANAIFDQLIGKDKEGLEGE